MSIKYLKTMTWFAFLYVYTFCLRVAWINLLLYI